jgi:ATP-binding cassette subfamily B protein
MFKLIRNLKAVDFALLLCCMALIFWMVWLELRMPEYMATITRLVQTENSDMKDIFHNGGMMLLCAAASLILSIGVSYVISTIAARFSLIIRKKLFNKVEELDYYQASQFSTSSLITRTTNDITQLQMVLGMGTQMLIRAPLTVTIAISKIMGKSWQWSSATAVAVVILLSFVAIMVSVVLPRFKVLQKLTDKLNGVTRENLTGIRVVHAFNAEKYQEDKFDKANDELTKTQIFTQRALSALSPMMYLVMEGVSLAIYFIGASLISGADAADKQMLFADMIVFSSYAMQIIISFLVLSGVFMIIPRAEVSAKRINEVLDTEPTIKNGELTESTSSERGTVEFHKVSFKYPDSEEYTLKDISFKVNKGETVAIVGSTGSGKTTLVNLIERFYDANEGEVFVDGENVRNYKQSSLRNKIAYVPQKTVMFDATVSANVSYGDNGKKRADEGKIAEALRVAQAKEFVEKMSGKQKAHIAQGGSNISGGQKQRLAIARAIARDPEIYIFDDSFSALDFKTDAKLRKELKEYTGGATNIIVAQRIGTIMHADQIIVLDEGKCVGKGKHADLLKHCDVYQQIAYSQLTKEELEA